LFNMPGVHVLDVAQLANDDSAERLRLVVETEHRLVGCPTCGQVGMPHGRRDRQQHDIPALGQPVLLVWRVRRYRCADPACRQAAFTQDHDLAPPRAKLKSRACWWAVGQLRREHASVAGIARQLGTSWRTVWRSIAGLLEAMAADESRFDGVRTLGVDEHIVRREALLFRMEVKDHHRRVVVAVR
jgi:transposase